MGNALSANFAPECDLPKQKYDDCFAKWYKEKFLQAKSVHNECEETWREYEDCLYVSSLFISMKDVCLFTDMTSEL